MGRNSTSRWSGLSRVVRLALVGLLVFGVVAALSSPAGASDHGNESERARVESADPVRPAETPPAVEPVVDDEIGVSENIDLAVKMVEEREDIPVEPTPVPTPETRDAEGEQKPGEPKITEPVVDDVEMEIPATVIVEPQPYAEVHVAKLGCPGSYGGDEVKLAANCTPMNAPFKVYSTNANDVFSGSFSLHVAPGAVVISEDVPQGWIEPIVFCTQVSGYDGRTVAFQPDVAGGDTVTINLKNGDVLDCRWYNIPALGKAHLTINKHECPPGFYPYASSWADIAAPCGPLRNGVPFVATFPNGVSYAQTSGESLDGIVYWMQIQAGVYTVEEVVPAGFGEPLVFCIRRDVDTDQVQEVFQATVYLGNRVIVDLYEDSNLFCDWYNVPLTGDGVIVIDKHDCPDAAVPVTDQPSLAAICTDDMNGVVFTLKHADGLKIEQATGDVYVSQVFVDHLPGGTYVMTEKLPAGYGSPRVFCGTMESFEGAVDLVVIEQSGPSIKVELPEGGIIFCDWYNIPG